MTVFRPSCRVRLQLRFDEGADVSPLRGKLELDPPVGASLTDTTGATAQGLTSQLGKVNGALRRLGKTRNDIPAAEYRKLRSRYESQREAIQDAIANQLPTEETMPVGLTTASPDQRVAIGSILPRSATISRNSIREPDEFECEIDFADAPIDPRVVRAAFVDLDLGIVSPEDYQLGASVGATRDDGSLLSLVERGTPETVMRSATKFVGYADEWHVSHDGSGGSVIKLRGRDLTACLMQRNLRRGEALDLDQPIEIAVQQLIDASPLTRGIVVKYGSPGHTTQGPNYSKAFPTVRKARRGKVKRHARINTKTMTLWDHVVDLTTQVGLVPCFFGFTLFLVEPETFFGRRASARKMIYGRNLRKLEFNRKLGGLKVPTIEVRSYDSVTGRTRWARAPKRGTNNNGVYGLSDPPKASRANEVSPAGGAEDKISVFPVRGITDGAQLERVAASLFQQVGRQEIEGFFETDDISSFDSAEEGDLLNILAGDSVELLIARPAAADTAGNAPTGVPTTTTVQELQQLSVAQRAAFLVRLGWKQSVATRMAEAQELTANNTVFRAKEASIEWSAETGITISVGLENFIVVRESKSETTGSTGPSPTMTALADGRSNTLAEAVRAGSAAQREAVAQRAQGQTTDPEYTEAAASATETQKGNVRSFKAQ